MTQEELTIVVPEQQYEELVKIENASKPEDVLDTRSPQEIEIELLKQQEQEALAAVAKLPPEELATQYFKMLYPLYKAKVHGLMARGAKEALDALVLYPLENDGIKFSSKVAEEVFSIGTRLMDAKFIIMQVAQINEQIKMEQKSKESANVDEILKNVETKFEQGEEVNG